MGGSFVEGSGTGGSDPSAPIWDILIPTLGQRRDSFARLLERLLPQTEPHGGQVRVVALWNNGERRVAEVRQDLLDYGDAEYRCFVDDDDLVSKDYVQQIMQALPLGPDMVGFNTEITRNGRRWRMANTDLKFGGFGVKGGKSKGLPILTRDIVHLCPIRTKIARQGSFVDTPPGAAEDMHWIVQMRGKVTNCHYIDRTLYHYQYSPAGSSHKLIGNRWQSQNIHPGPHIRLEVDHPNFSYHPWGQQ